MDTLYIITTGGSPFTLAFGRVFLSREIAESFLNNYALGDLPEDLMITDIQFVSEMVVGAEKSAITKIPEDYRGAIYLSLQADHKKNKMTLVYYASVMSPIETYIKDPSVKVEIVHDGKLTEITEV